VSVGSVASTPVPESLVPSVVPPVRRPVGGAVPGRRAALGLVDRAVLVALRDSLAREALVDDDALVGHRLCRRAAGQHVGADGRVDRRGDVGVRRHREVDGRRGVEPEVEVGVEVEEADDLLVG
jgi:hypothetical protein